MESFKKEHYGTMPDGSEIHQFRLKNDNDVVIRVIEYGGIITELWVPDKHGILADVVLGHDSLDDYLESDYYLGALIGRYGNRIANARFALDGTEFELDSNDTPNNLHGGETGFHTQVWKGKEVSVLNGTALKLTYISKDREEGFPGNLTVEVIYILTNNNELIVDYTATTDKKTIVNLTQHSYFNLSGMKEDILGLELEINADRFVEIGEGAIPTGLLKTVKNSPFDFTSPKAIGKDIHTEHPQLKLTDGFDITMALNKVGHELDVAAKLVHPASGRIMEVLTTEPGVHFYSGNALENTPKGKGDTANNPRTGLCLETQHFPDSPNQTEFPSVVLDVDQKYRSTTIYRFDTFTRKAK
ncbi:MAG: aldose epimerase family protein [Balneolaceae bacterium]